MAVPSNQVKSSNVTLVESDVPPDFQTTQENVLSAIKGPLSALNSSGFNKFTFKYPRDLESTTKGHSVRFDIFEVNPVSLQELTKTISETVTPLANAVVESVKDQNGTVKKINDATVAGSQGVIDAVSSTEKFTETFKNIKKIAPVTTRTNTTSSGAITLYMPETLEFNYAAQYNKLSLAEAASSLPGVGSIAQAITSYISPGGNAALRLGLNYAGYVFNPQEQVLFEGIDFRTYTMSFTFTPFSSQEAQEVSNIIQKFREHAAPSILNTTAGFFFNPPSVFKISFLNNGQENTNINKLKRSVLENVDVNYAPNGWSAHEDGAPVQTTITLQFKEIELVDRAAIQMGY